MWKSFLCGFRNRKKNKVLARIAIEFSQSKHGAPLGASQILGMGLEEI